MTGERNKIIWGEIVARAWRDEAFKEQLLSNPKQVLTDAGMAVSEGVELQVIEDTPTVRHLVFPVVPSGGSQELAEEQLELVSGGTGDDPNIVIVQNSSVTQNMTLAGSEVQIAYVEATVAASGVAVLV